MHATKIAIVSNCDQLHESAVFFLFTNSCDFAWTWNNVTWFALNTVGIYIFLFMTGWMREICQLLVKRLNKFTCKTVEMVC